MNHISRQVSGLVDLGNLTAGEFLELLVEKRGDLSSFQYSVIEPVTVMGFENIKSLGRGNFVGPVKFENVFFIDSFNFVGSVFQEPVTFTNSRSSEVIYRDSKETFRKSFKCFDSPSIRKALKLGGTRRDWFAR